MIRRYPYGLLAVSIIFCFGGKVRAGDCPPGERCVIDFTASRCEDRGDPVNYDCDGKLRPLGDRLARQQRADEEAAQRAAREAEKAAFEAKVAEQVTRMGKHREAEARRFVEMHEKALKAAGRTDDVPESCEKKFKTGRIGTGIRFARKSDALSHLQSKEGRYNCPSGAYTLVSAPQCESGKRGLTVQQKRHLLAAGIAVTEPDISIEWGCSADYRCLQRQTICKAGAGHGSRQ